MQVLFKLFYKLTGKMTLWFLCLEIFYSIASVIICLCSMYNRVEGWYHGYLFVH